MPKKFRSIVLTANVPTKNNRIYSRKALLQIKAQVDSEPTKFLTMPPNTIDPKQFGMIKVMDMIAQVVGCEIENNRLIVEFEFMETMPMCKLLEDMNISKFDIKPRAMGHVAEDGEVDPDTLMFICFDLCGVES